MSNSVNNYFMGNIMSDFKKYHCMECEHIYDEEKGDPDSGIAPGTCWADIPDDWSCPICGAPKSFFKLLK
jgi:rubredoxin